MNRMLRLAAFAACLLCAIGARAQTAPVQDHCYLGGTKAITSGLSSTNYLDGIVPSCAVTVYLTGTQTKATIYSDGSGTALSNPFTANAAGSVNPGGWIFWAALNQGYDIVLSGGIPPLTYAQPVTQTDRFAGYSFAGNLPTAADPGQIITSTGPGSTYSVQGGVFYSQPGDTVSSIEAECSAACMYIVTTPQTITLSSSHSLSSNVSLYFQAGGLWTVNGAFTLTIPAQVQGTLNQHFAGSSTIAFGNLQAFAPVEWFGAVGDSTTNSTAGIQAALNSLVVGQALLQLGTYKVSAPLTITRPGIGIKGTIMRITSPTIYTIPPATEIVSTSASADVIDVSGVSSSNTVTFNKFDDFTIERSVMPTGTSAGISLNYTYGVMINHVGIQDSVRGIYVHGSGAQGSGAIENTSITWGYNGVAEPSGNVYGIYVDSADGQQSPSMRVRNSFVADNNTNPSTVSYGMALIGTAINDQVAYGFETAHVNYGVYMNQTGAGSIIASSDIHFYGTINDGCLVSCFYMTGLTAGGGAGVEINGGYLTESGSSTNPLIDIESSSGVRVIGVQLGVAANTLASACIDVQDSSDVTITANQCQGVRNVGILLSNSTAVAVTGNDLRGNASVNGLINLTNSSLNSITGNVLSGTGLSMSVDVNSVNNTGLFDNPIAASLTPASIVGANPNAFGNSEVRTTIFRLGGSGSTWTQSAGAPSGACINGSMSSNSLTTSGTYATYQCKGTAWVGIGTAY